MGETGQILALWRRAQARGERVCLATVVAVDGSSYRKPGARMLLTSGGERAGTISGGCLEAEVSRKAWWLTANGPVVERYASSLEEDGAGWGLGCGGIVSILLEQEPIDVLQAMARAAEAGEASVVLSPCKPGAGPGTKVVWQAAPVTSGLTYPSPDTLPAGLPAQLQSAVERSRREQHSLSLDPEDGGPAWFVEYLAPPPRLTIFGAGDDARPIAEFALALGWRVTVADGRSPLLRPERFPAGTALRLLVYEQSTGPDGTSLLSPVDTGVEPGTLAVILTHSYEQDRNLLAALLPRDLLYLGILGPRHRTTRLLEEIAPGLGFTVEQCFHRLHAPVGLDLGARDPAAIALSIVAELQATLAGRHVSVSRATGSAGREPSPVPALAYSHG